MNKTTALQQARRAANKRQETMIVFHDENYGTFDYCSESHYHFLLDTNQLTESDVTTVVNPR
jgi:hypothetical protein